MAAHADRFHFARHPARGRLRAHELSEVPPRVVISEYIDVAHAFFEGDEPRVVNGVLDALARKLRPGDLPERGKGQD